MAVADVTYFATDAFSPDVCQPQLQSFFRITDEENRFSEEIPTKGQGMFCSNPEITQITVSALRPA